MGRVFSRRLYSAMSGLKNPAAHIRLTSNIKQDLVVWLKFLEKVGSVGFGAIWGNHWCAETWPNRWVTQGFSKNIVLLELFPVIIALEIWGKGRFVCCKCIVI